MLFLHGGRKTAMMTVKEVSELTGHVRTLLVVECDSRSDGLYHLVCVGEALSFQQFVLHWR